MAAGQGFKTFTTGEVLTAGDVNGYLMQGINVFATTTARDAAITAPAEGQFAFTKDTNSLWYYDGAAWVASGATGDIEGVTAGVGISGGGTSGTVTVTNSMATAIDAKGDLVPGTGSDTFARLPVGANNTILVADSSTATGLKWAAPVSGSPVIQVKNATDGTNTIVGQNTTWTDTGLTISITPTLSTSKILVFASINGIFKSPGNENSRIGLRLMRNSTAIHNIEGIALRSGDARALGVAGSSTTYLDSPATTSATTYKVQMLNWVFADYVAVNMISEASGSNPYMYSTSSITVMEIGV